jgi:hypothetical protein
VCIQNWCIYLLQQQYCCAAPPSPISRGGYPAPTYE